MKSAAKFLLPFFLLAMAATVTAQNPSHNAPGKAPGTISGRITSGSEPAAGVEVLLKPSGNSPVNDMLQSGPTISATTDSGGWYRITGVAPGNYRLVAYAPAFVIEGESNPFAPGKTVNVGEGETIDNINFSITRGGVITGKVTDPDNRAVIAEAVRAYKLDAKGKRDSSGIPDFSMWQTDDRGVYRIFGLEPGKYIVSAGASSEDAAMR
ncbi:MAG: carboxypeptidase regulatory-like domain-containing protein, partial [Blastocatellia bacterium]